MKSLLATHVFWQRPTEPNGFYQEILVEYVVLSISWGSLERGFGIGIRQVLALILIRTILEDPSRLTVFMVMFNRLHCKSVHKLFPTERF